MTVKIRRGVFETNSSSTHSILISKDAAGLMDVSLSPDVEGNVVLQGGEFGWEQDSYHDAQSKASYLAIYVQDWTGTDRDAMKQVLCDVIKAQTGCKAVIFGFSTGDDGKNWSYIDHQSVEGNSLHYLWKDTEEIRQFIFNPKSVLRTDNDNH